MDATNIARLLVIAIESKNSGSESLSSVLMAEKVKFDVGESAPAVPSGISVEYLNLTRTLLQRSALNSAANGSSKEWQDIMLNGFIYEVNRLLATNLVLEEQLIESKDPS